MSLHPLRSVRIHQAAKGKILHVQILIYTRITKKLNSRLYFICTYVKVNFYKIMVVIYFVLFSQEQVAKLDMGSMPRSMWVTLEDDLVETCKPGDDVVVW